MRNDKIFKSPGKEIKVHLNTPILSLPKKHQDYSQYLRATEICFPPGVNENRLLNRTKITESMKYTSYAGTVKLL